MDNTDKIKTLQEVVRVIKQNIVHIEKEIEHIVAGTYVPAGSVYFANLPALSEERVGYVYDIKDDFTTTSDFMEGAGKRYSAGTNVGIVRDDNGNPKYDCFSGLIDTTEIYTEIGKKQNIVLSKEIAGSTNVEGSLTGLENLSGTIELEISDLQGSILRLDTAIDGKLGKNEKAASAGSADFATKAVNDGHDNEIAATYLTKTDAASTYLGINAKATSAVSADTAGTATNALKDSNNVDIDITSIQSSIAGVAQGLTSLGTAADMDVPESGDAADNEVVLGRDSRLSDSRSASDVYPWAKAATKPSYEYSEIGNTPTLGTAASKDVPASGNAGLNEVVLGNDGRLSNARPASDVYSWAKEMAPDDELSDSSTNAVQNKVVKAYVDTNVTQAITNVLNTHF